VLDLQSKGKFTAQTKAAMALLAASGHSIHSQGKVEVYAGGGMAPGPCGSGAPAGPTDSGAPAVAAENITNIATSALSMTKAWQDLKAATEKTGLEGDAAGLKATADLIKGAAGMGAGFKSSKDAAKEVGGVMETVAGAMGVVGAVATGDIGSAISGISSIISGTSALGGAGAGGADVEARASTWIKYVAGKKISGLAPLGIDFKTPAKFEARALAVTDFTTLVFSNYALAKFEVKCLDQVKTTSSKYDFSAKATADIECGASFTGKSAAIKDDGVVVVTKKLTVKGDTTMDKTLEVKQLAKFKDTLTVKEAVTVKGKIQVENTVVIKDRTTVKGATKSKVLVVSGRVTFTP
jgi:hypothetical protein